MDLLGSGKEFICIATLLSTWPIISVDVHSNIARATTSCSAWAIKIRRHDFRIGGFVANDQHLRRSCQHIDPALSVHDGFRRRDPLIPGTADHVAPRYSWGASAAAAAAVGGRGPCLRSRRTPSRQRPGRCPRTETCRRRTRAPPPW